MFFNLAAYYYDYECTNNYLYSVCLIFPKKRLAQFKSFSKFICQPFLVDIDVIQGKLEVPVKLFFCQV